MTIREIDSEIQQKNYEEELLLCKKAGGDVEKYRRLSFDVPQLEQIRLGLEKGLNVESYLDPKKSWLEMEEIRVSLETGFDMSSYVKQGYNWIQCIEIRAGIQKGLDVSPYLDTAYLAPQMREIRKGIEKGLDISLYASPQFDWFQMHEVRHGLEEKLDASIYANPDYKYTTMRAIRFGMKEGVDLIPYVEKGYTGSILNEVRRGIRMNYDITEYLEDGYDTEQLKQINNAHEAGVNLLPYLRKGFHGVQLQEIIVGLKENLDVSKYATEDFNWLQMREIRNGLEQNIDVSPYASPEFTPKQMEAIRKGLLDGLDVSQYAKVYYDPEQMEEIREDLEKSGAKLTEEMEEMLRDFLPTDVPDEEEFNFENEVEESYLLDSCVLISEDQMLVTVDFSPAKEEKMEEIEKMTVPDVIRLLKHHDVKQGIDRGQIKKMLENKVFDKPVVVAKGKPAVNGSDGKFKYYFRQELDRKPKVREDGSVDYKNMELFESVKRDALIAEYLSATQGVFGYDVKGNILAPTRGKELPPLKGEGFVMSEDKKQYFALTDGIIELDPYDNKLVIRNLYRVTGDVDASTGNIQFNGDVNVMGNVQAGFSISATGNVVIDGYCEHCHIEAGKDVIIRKGCQGQGKGEIIAGGGIIGQFFESVTLIAIGNIEASYLLNSQVRTEGKLLVEGRRGVIIGGYICAKQGVNCFGIGNIAEIRTMVEVGINKDDMRAYQELLKKIDKVDAELKTCESALQKLMEQPKRDEKMTAFIERLTKAVYTQKLKKKELLKQREADMEKMTLQRGARIQVTGRVFPGTYLYLNSNVLAIKETCSNVEFVTRENKVDAVMR